MLHRRIRPQDVGYPPTGGKRPSRRWRHASRVNIHSLSAGRPFMRLSGRPSASSFLRRASRRGVGALSLMLLGQQAVLVGWSSCLPLVARCAESSASAAMPGHHAMHHVANPSNTRAPRSECDRCEMEGACGSGVVLAQSSSTLLAVAPVVASLAIVATHARPSSFAVAPDVPPPRR